MKVRQRHILLVLTAIFSQLMGPICWADETVYWMAGNYPPAYILDGEHKGEGFADVAGKLFRQGMPQYRHQIIEDIAVSRMHLFWDKSEKTYCSPSMGVVVGQFPNTVYSKITLYVPPVGILIRKADKDRFINTSNGRTSIEKLLEDSTLKLGINEGQQNGQRIDTLLTKYQGQPHIYKRPGTDVAALFMMLALKRLDYVLVWSVSVQTVLKKITQEKCGYLLYLPVIEARTEKGSHAICSDTPLGRQVVERINHILIQERYKNTVTETLLKFLPESLHGEYRTLNMQQIGN